MPLEQTGNAITFYGFYTKSGLGVTGLTVTADVWEVEIDGSATELQSAAGATEIGDGLYRYILASGSVDAEGEYLCVFKTAGDVDQKHIAACWTVSRAGIENLDAAMSSRSAAATALTDATWTDARAGYLDELAAANIPADLDAVLADTNELQVDDYPTSIAAIKAETALIVADTNELQVDDYPTSIAAVQTAVDAILLDTGTEGVVLTAAAIDAIHDEVIEGTLTYRQITRILLAVLAGISTGGGTTSVAFRNVADDADRVAATVTGVGNRTAITLDGS